MAKIKANRAPEASVNFGAEFGCWSTGVFVGVAGKNCILNNKEDQEHQAPVPEGALMFLFKSDGLECYFLEKDMIKHFMSPNVDGWFLGTV